MGEGEAVTRLGAMMEAEQEDGCLGSPALGGTQFETRVTKSRLLLSVTSQPKSRDKDWTITVLLLISGASNLRQ